MEGGHFMKRRHSADREHSMKKGRSSERDHPVEEKNAGKNKRSGREMILPDDRYVRKEMRINEKMECKDFERHIPDFITKKMDYPTLKRFYEHVRHCPDCREELDIQFLVQEGMQRLEEGNAFDLQAELEQRMEDAVKSIRYHSAFLYFGIAMELVAVGVLAGIVIWILL